MFFDRFNGMTPVAVSKAISGTSRGSMPGTLLIAAGNYTLVPEGMFDLHLPGLYRIWVPVDDPVTGDDAYTYNYIVAGHDAYALTSAIAWLTSFANRGDSFMTNADLTNLALHSTVHLACGFTAIWTKSLADAAGIPCRICHVLTAGPLNGYSEGHVILEMKVNGVWKIFDPSYKMIFRDKTTNAQLNMIEVIAGLKADTAMIEKIAPFKWTSEVALVGGFDSSAYIDRAQLYTDAGMLAEMKQDYQIPFIEDPTTGAIIGYLPAGTESRASWVTDVCHYQIIPQAQFMATYY